MNGLTDVMIDLETLGLKPGCKILSIGAVSFSSVQSMSRSVPLQFYARASKDTQPELQADRGTIAWWDKQSEAAKQEAFAGTAPLSQVLVEFAASLGILGNVRVWGNAASFDISILEAAFEVYNIPIPWSYKNVMCFRTLKNLYKSVPEPALIGTKHSAIADATHQARWAEDIFRVINHGR